jgi:CRP-like cAMP-binding protein/rhodanese-related sulfurtransferase
MVNISLLRQFVPLGALLPTDLVELEKHSRIGNYQPGQVIFTRGESAKTVVYLVTGSVELYSEAGTKVVKSGSAEAKHPIAQGAKRTATGTVLTPAQVLFVDRDNLDLILTWSQSAGVEVVEADDSDWMAALLQSQAFHRIPPGNIAQIFAAMQPVDFKAGDIVIRQGDPGDYYYVITAGTCQVMQLDTETKKFVEVDRLGVGRAFGEEALVSGNPRNASVRALTPCSLMRLSAEDFARLLKAPLFRETSPDDVPSDAVLIDVRLPAEYKKGRLPDAINMPLSRLRKMADKLDPAKVYVVYCDSGRRSASATFLLNERGFDARLLAGGIPADEMPVS